jgi:hypothetical protein
LRDKDEGGRMKNLPVFNLQSSTTTGYLAAATLKTEN